MEKKKTILTAAVVLLVVFAAGFYLYSASHPWVEIDRAIPAGAAEDQYIEVIMVAYGGNDRIPISAKVSGQLRELHEWNMTVNEEIYANVSNGPYHVGVSGEISGGKTTLRYSGYYTSADGAKTDLFAEKTFDFVLDKTLFD